MSRPAGGRARATKSMDFVGAPSIPVGEEVTLVIPDAFERDRIRELASREFPQPCVVAIWSDRTRYLPIDSLEALDDGGRALLRAAMAR